MKIVTPLSNIDCYESLVEAGADEFFCGVVPYGWLKKYNVSLPLNRREFLLDGCNITDMTSMKILSKLVEKHKIPVKITLNSQYYISKHHEFIIGLIKQLMDIGFTTFIIADIALVALIRERGINCNIHISGETSTINHLSIHFLDQFNISRYIFPAKTSIYEIKQSIINNKKKDTEFEAFMLNDWCSFLGAFCNTIHCDEMPHTCHIPYRNVRINDDSSRFEDSNRMFKIMAKIDESTDFNNSKAFYNLGKRKASFYKLGENGCGLCKILELKEIGITHLKVVGRGNLLERLINDVKNVKDIIGIAEDERNTKHFETTVKEKYFNNKCPDKCYYHE